MGLYFEKEDKEILNEAVTPLQVVEYLGLPGQKIGPNISILCPASDHNDHSYGNCVVYDQGRKCRCFACQRSFTPLSILIEAGHYSFYEAMCILASMAHMEDRFESTGRVRKKRKELPKLDNMEKKLIGIFLKYKWQKESCREEMRKSEPFGMHQEIISGMSPLQTHGWN